VVATSSGAIAASLGFEDHEHAPRAEMLAAARRIAASVDVPVTVDSEAGYGLPPAELARALLDVGAAGCNLEDTDHATGALRGIDEQAAYLRDLRAAADELGYPLVINARVDVFLASGGAEPAASVMADGLARAAAYRAAGADCVFPILLRPLASIEAFVRGVPAPVNVLALPGHSLSGLASLGVRRISFGSRLYRDAMAHLEATLDSLESP
jgi:2-methylisocitrate lyase-like PEP mutase family enzyme